MAVIFIVTHFNQIVSFFAGIPGAIGSALSTVGNVVAGIFGGVVNIVIDALNFIIGKLNWVIDTYNSVAGTIGSVLGFGNDLNVGHVGTIGHVNLGASAPAAAKPSQKSNAQPANSSPQPGHSAQSAAPIVLHHTTKIGQRVVAEETVHYAARRTSLGAAVMAH